MIIIFFIQNLLKVEHKPFGQFPPKGGTKYYRFSHKDFGKEPDQNYQQAYNSTLRTNFYLGTKYKIFMTKSVLGIC